LFVAAATLLLGLNDEHVEVPARQTLIADVGTVKSIAFRPDGAMLSSVGVDGSMTILNLTADTKNPPLPRAAGSVRGATFSPDNKVLATANAMATVTLHDLVNHETLTLKDTTGSTKGAACLACSPDGATLAVGQEDGRITLWDAATRRKRSTLAGHQEFVAALAYAPDGATLASSGGEGTTKIWDLLAGQERFVITSPNTAYVALAFSRDSRLLCLGDHTSPIVRVWDLTAGVERAALEGATSPVLAVGTSPDGITLAAADYLGKITFWNLATLRIRPRRLKHAGVRSLAFTPVGNALATGGFDGTIHLWTFRSPSVDSQALVARAGDGIIVRSQVLRVWLPKTLTELAVRQFPSLVAIRTHDELRRFLEGVDQKDLWYALTVRSSLANGEIEDLTVIRWPYQDPDHFSESAAVLALAAGSVPIDQTVDFSTAALHFLPEDLTGRAPREIMGELLGHSRPRSARVGFR
jgi:WD40 repeat protein